MRKFLLLFLILEVAHCKSCPRDFELVRDGECRGEFPSSYTIYAKDAVQNLINNCASTGGKAVMIHDAEHQAYWTSKVTGWFLLSLRCNTGTKQWEWGDGSSVDYKPAGLVDGSCISKPCNPAYTWILAGGNGRWTMHTINWGIGPLIYHCTTQLPKLPTCDSPDDNNGVCYPATCSSGPFKEGQLISSPGYPYDASVPCDLTLSVEAGKQVELTITFLEANSCCDRLVVNEDVAILANLTGDISGSIVTTKASNVMKVSWQPNGGSKVRGVQMTYRGLGIAKEVTTTPKPTTGTRAPTTSGAAGYGASIIVLTVLSAVLN